jgi:hypothetical protein
LEGTGIRVGFTAGWCLGCCIGELRLPLLRSLALLLLGVGSVHYFIWWQG